MKEWMKKNIKLIISVIVLFLIFLMITPPFLINWEYMNGPEKPNTVFQANDWMQFHGTFLAFLATIILGIIAIWQNKNAYEISKQLIELEKNRDIPSISVNAYSGEDFSIRRIRNDYYIINRNDYLLNFKEDSLVILSLVNEQERDITIVLTLSVKCKVEYEDEIQREVEFKTWNGTLYKRLKAGSEIPLVINGLWNEIKEQYPYPLLYLEVIFVLKNYRGVPYSQVIKLTLMKKGKTFEVVSVNNSEIRALLK